MFKKIISVLTVVLVLCMSMNVCFASESQTNDEGKALIISDAVLTVEEGTDKGELKIIVSAENEKYNLKDVTLSVTKGDDIKFLNSDIKAGLDTAVSGVDRVVEIGDIDSGMNKEVIIPVETSKEKPEVNCKLEYVKDPVVINLGEETNEKEAIEYKDVLKLNLAEVNAPATEKEEITKKEAIMNFLMQTGFSMTNWQSVVMILISCVLFYLAIVKKFEPLLLLPIAFGMLLTNLMGAEVFHESLFAGGHVHWDEFGIAGLIDYLYLGVKLGIYPCLIFVGVGAMTDFGPLIANPKSLLLGAAAQVGIFATFLGALAFGFTPQEAGSIGIIGGADGPTAIFVTSKLAPDLLGPIAVAAYSYMALVPVIQPPIMKLLTTKKERQIEMPALRKVSQKEKIIFPVVVTIFVALLVPSAAPLVGCLMLGNLLKESGVCERLSKTVQNELMNIVTVFLGISVGATATASTFLKLETIKIIVMGIVAFGVATACGVLLAKFMNLFLKRKINPLIGSAGVSAVPMAARVSQKVGQEANPGNFLLMHAMGPNVAGVIGSAIAAGALIAMLG